VGLIVGFALFGAITFLPLFFQTVNGASPTGSGLRLVPLMVGLLVTSIGSGRVITRIGRYRPFPIAGTALMTLGFVLLSGLGTDATTLSSSLRLVVLGLGLGLWCWPFRTQWTSATWASPHPARPCFARSAARSARRCLAQCSPTA
jgi:MFS family permease